MMNTVKKIRIGALAIMLMGFSMLFVGNAAAQVEANVTLASDYLFRGVTQTNHDPAIQGGFDWGHDSGFYLGIWASNVDFGGPENIEIDYYGGWGTETEGGIAFNVGYIYYDYFDGDLSLQEVYGSVGFFGFTAGVAIEVDGLEGSNNYYSLDYAYDFEQGFSLYAGVGKYDLEQQTRPNLPPLEFNYTHYWIGASAEFLSLTWDISYHDGGDNYEAFGGESRGVVTVSKSF
jgi:uncharacterized protein (TIGR02001 family)